MAIQKNDFVEIEFTGKANGQIFDTTNKEEAKKIGIEADVNPLVVSAGNQMVLKGLDEELMGKEIGKKYSIHLTSDKAFGKRDPQLIKIIPMRVFREKNINPEPGMAFQLDNYLVRILSVSGGRVTADFNNPLAGKEIDYEFTIKRKVENSDEKINSLQDYFFKKRFDFKIDVNGKKVVFKNQEIKPLIQMMAGKFREMTGFDFEVEDKKEEPAENKKEEVDKK